MKTIVHRAEDRGKANYGWLDTKYSFSFSRYYDPDKMGFGLLRVLNDDIVKEGSGFGTHPHDNMEIITIVLEGALEHKDSMGTGAVIHKDEVQVMSAGRGITHSEFNPSETEPVKLFQLWIFPKERNIDPRYDQKSFPSSDRINELKTVVSGYKEIGSLYIHQNAEIKLGNFTEKKSLKYNIRDTVNGVYLMIIDGHISINGEDLYKKDAVGIFGTREFSFDIDKNTNFVLIEVPMQ
ncbi:MAG TPA: pirin family protein [Ignavibacteriaceae bacterium]|nr:pirin family protein [Ignavibacteriaceae bacterium]